MMEAISLQGDIATITAKFKNPYRSNVCVLIKLYKSCQCTTENATKLLLFYFLVAHCCNQLKATGPSHEESVTHAAQGGIFLVFWFGCRQQQKCHAAAHPPAGVRRRMEKKKTGRNWWVGIRAV